MSQFSVGMLNLIKDLTNQNLKFYNPIYIIPYSYYCCDANTHTSIGIMHHNAWQTTKRKPCIHISLTVQGKATFTFTYALLTCSMYHFLSGTESFPLQLFDDYSFWSREFRAILEFYKFLHFLQHQFWKSVNFIVKTLACSL